MLPQRQNLNMLCLSVVTADWKTVRPFYKFQQIFTFYKYIRAIVISLRNLEPVFSLIDRSMVPLALYLTMANIYLWGKGQEKP